MKNWKALAIAGAVLSAGGFSAGAANAACTGNCGVLGADGVVTAPPGGGSYNYVTTNGGVGGAGQIASVGGTNGSEALSALFTVGANSALSFDFNYVTSDGAGFADYGFAELVDNTSNHVAWLFTARTTTSGDTSPGFGLPANDSVLTPAGSPIIPGGPAWSPLGGSSGACWSGGCGYTGWIQSDYTIASAGTYAVRFGVTNWGDGQFDTGLAYSGIVADGNGVGDVPEPATWAMMMVGVFGLGAALRTQRKAKAVAA